MRVHRSGALIAQIGEQAPHPGRLDQIPESRQARVLAAEDERFFAHHGSI